MSELRPKLPEIVPVVPPPPEQRARRAARFPEPGQRATRYSLPTHLSSTSPVGYRMRVNLTRAEAELALPLLALERPRRFAGPQVVTEGELFEECSLGILSARQSTNFGGHRAVVFGPDDSRRICEILRGLDERHVPVLDDCSYTHVVLTHPYRTPFTSLLTMVGHKPLANVLTVPLRLARKRLQHVDDIPSIGFLQHLHLGVLADGMERATLVASRGERRAQIHLAPFCGEAARRNRAGLRALDEMCGVTALERSQGWRVGLVAQVGRAVDEERVEMPAPLWRKLGATLMALRSERILPGVNPPAKAPDVYLHRQRMDVPEELTVQAGRAAYNAFAHWTGIERERAKDLLLLERIDVLTRSGEERMRRLRAELDDITGRVRSGLPRWAEALSRGALGRTVELGRKAFDVAGQRAYLGGLSRREVANEGLDWELAVVATGAAAARSALLVELTGCVALPQDCDLLAGICIKTGPVHQNDIGKQFFGYRDLLAEAHPGRDATTLLMWTLEAKTVADPIGNEEQLLNPAERAPLVGLRPGPHQVVRVGHGGELVRMRQRADRLNNERAFGDVGNFATDPDGRDIPGNRGTPWPDDWRREAVWSE